MDRHRSSKPSNAGSNPVGHTMEVYMKEKCKIFPQTTARYNDIAIHCPRCHKQIIIFEGYYKIQVCSRCGYSFRDKLYKRSCVAYKRKKQEETKSS